MRKDKNPALEEHFDKLKDLLPEIHRSSSRLPRNISEKLYSLLKSSLSIIEAVYLQSPDHFSNARVEAYASIVSDLDKIGISYQGNEELLGKAASQIIMQEKLPMERAGRRKEEGNQDKKAG